MLFNNNNNLIILYIILLCKVKYYHLKKFKNMVGINMTRFSETIGHLRKQ